MKIILSLLSLVFITTAPLSAQVNAANQDTALRLFMGVRSVGTSFTVSPPALSGFATVLVFKDGKFWKRIGDTPIPFTFGQTPIARGNPEAGYAPASVKVEFLWGPREGKIGYLVLGSYNSTGLIPDFHEMPELAAINFTSTDVSLDLSEPEFREMALLGAAYAMNRAPKSESVEDAIKAADIALIVVFKKFNSAKEAKEFIEALNKKY